MITIPTLTPVETVDELRLSIQAALRRLVDQLNNEKVSDTVDVNNNRIANVAWPTNNLDAVNVEYLKDQIGGGKKRNININGGKAGLWVARAIIPGVQVVANDVLAHRYRVDLKSAGQSVGLIFCAVTAKVIPIGSEYIADVQVSTDGGTTFNSLFPSGSANKVVLPLSGLNWAVITPTWDIGRLNIGDQLRVDVLQVDGTVSGVEIALVGILSS